MALRGTHKSLTGLVMMGAMRASHKGRALGGLVQPSGASRVFGGTRQDGHLVVMNITVVNLTLFWYQTNKSI
jgi:ribosomal protein L3